MCYETNREKLVREAYRLSEAALESDVSAANASDQRASTFAAGSLAAAALLAGFFDQKSPDSPLLFGAALFVVAAAIAIFASRPRKFYFPGAQFNDFEKELHEDGDFIKAIEDMAAFNDRHSAHNRGLLYRNSRTLNFAYIVGLCSAIVAISPQLFLSLTEVKP
jgi:hypothetical protein